MALPTSFGASSFIIPPSLSNLGPYIYSGNVYVILKTTSTATTISALKATDPTSSFTEQDSANRPDLTNTVLRTIATAFDGQYIHVAFMRWNSGANAELWYARFNCATDSWVDASNFGGSSGATEYNFWTATNPSSIYDNVDITVRSDGDVIIVYDGEQPSTMGGLYQEIAYARLEGTTWTAGVVVASTAAKDDNYRNPRVVMGSSDQCHFTYGRDTAVTDRYFRALSGANALRTQRTYSAGITSSLEGKGVFTRSGTETISFGITTSGDCGRIDFPHFTDDTNPTYDRDMVGSGNSPSYQGERYAIDKDETNQPAYIARNTSSSVLALHTDSAGETWSSESTDITTGTPSNMQSLSANIFQRGSNIVYAFIYEDPITVYYDEYVLRTLSSTSVSTSLDSALEKTFSVSTSINSALQKTFSVSTSLDGALEKAFSVSTSIDSALQKALSVSTSIEASLQKSFSVSTAIDAVIVKQFDISTSIDAVLQKEVSISTSLDSALEKTFSVSTSLDSALEKTFSVSTSLEAVLQKAFSVSTSIEASLQKSLEITTAIDAHIVPGVVTNTISTSLEASLQKSFEITASLDSALQKSFSVSTAADAVLVKQFDVSTSIDSTLQKEISASTSLDSALQKTLNISTTLDAALQKAFSISTDVDAVLQKEFSVSTFLDATLQKEISVNTSLEASLEKTLTISTSLDSVLALVGYLRPDADSSTGSWLNELGGATLYTSIDEVTPNDNDYIISGNNPTDDICKIRLSDPLGSIQTGRPVVVRYRYRKEGTDTRSLTVRLVQNTTTIATWVHSNIAGTEVTAEQTLTSPQKSSITNWNDLFLEFEAD